MSRLCTSAEARAFHKTTAKRSKGALAWAAVLCAAIASAAVLVFAP